MRSAPVQIPDRDEVLGEVPLAPYALTGVSEAQLARAVVDQLLASSRSKTEAFKRLRSLFPDLPLTARLAGLAALMRR